VKNNNIIIRKIVILSNYSLSDKGKGMLQFYCTVSAICTHCTAQHNKRCLVHGHFVKSVILHNFTC